MKVNSIHPTEIALQIIKEGVEAGQKASDCKADLMEIMQIEEVTADKIIQDLLSRKVIFRDYLIDDFCGKLLFFVLEKPKPRPVKKIGHMIIADSFMTGIEITQSTGIRTFAKKKNTVTNKSYTFAKRVLPQNSIIAKKGKRIVNLVRTKWPEENPLLVRTKWTEPKIKLIRKKFNHE